MPALPHQTSYRIAESLAEINFNKNGLALVEVGGKTITIAHHNDQIFACAHKCPHAGGILAEGYLDAIGNIVCPLHRYKFSLQNGRNTSGEGYYLKTYSIEIFNDAVFVSF